MKHQESTASVPAPDELDFFDLVSEYGSRLKIQTYVTAADPGMFLLEFPESIILRIQFNNERIPTMMMIVVMRSEGDDGDYSI